MSIRQLAKAVGRPESSVRSRLNLTDATLEEKTQRRKGRRVISQVKSREKRREAEECESAEKKRQTEEAQMPTGIRQRLDSERFNPLYALNVSDEVEAFGTIWARWLIRRSGSFELRFRALDTAHEHMR